MAKISPVSTKYMIHAKFEAQGAVEKPDIIGALFGQTEGLLGSELEIRDLQKEGKIGRIEVELERQDGKTIGKIEVPTALDQSETSLIAAAIETIERIGPTEAKIEVEKIEDVRGSKRKYIIERAKKLLGTIQGATDSREISQTIKTSSRAEKIREYGKENLPAGDISKEEIIVVEGRADVINLLKNRIDNVIGMAGTKLPETIKQLGEEKTLILFLDGDRGGRLIAKNAIDNANISYVAFAPDGKEVEELSGKEILATLRKKIPAEEFSSSFPPSFSRKRTRKIGERTERIEELQIRKKPAKKTRKKIDEEKLKEIFDEINGTKKAYLLDENLNIIKKVSNKNIVRNLREGIFAIVIDGTATTGLIRAAEKAGCQYIAAKNFSNVRDTSIELISF